MATVQLRKYSIETYNPETGKSDYSVEEELHHIPEKAIDYLRTPEEDNIHWYEWVRTDFTFTEDELMR